MIKKQSQKVVYAWLPNICKILILLALFGGFASAQTPPQPANCNRMVTADVVAFDQIIFYNRFGSFDPGGMMFALKRDVVTINTALPLGAGNAQLRPDKRPRPIVLRVNEGDCLQVTFTNWLNPSRKAVEDLKFANAPDQLPYFGPPVKIPPDPNDPNGPTEFDGKVHLSQGDTPATRTASMHVNGLDLVGSIASDGSNVGKNASSLAAVGQVRVYTWYAAKQGQYLLFSTAATSGGEGDGGQVVHGLFGTVNVEPAGAKWYRSQVTPAVLTAATIGTNANGTPKINYEATFPNSGGQFTPAVPVLNILNSSNQIIYTDLNAVVTGFTEDCTKAPPSGTCGQPFREFSVLFHDELETGAPAFPEMLTDRTVFASVKDGFGINYGSSSVGTEVLANRKKVGPSANCPECNYEEFFLESYGNGDPAVLVKYGPIDPSTGFAKAIAGLFPDDPGNVHHSYLNDPVRFRNVHAGPKETHVFHLHQHQWLQSPRDENSLYLDSQTISPGASFTYEIQYGGGGNRNLGSPGDSIFHCHLYPHFAQGMWELWRNHDVFENGTVGLNPAVGGNLVAGRNLPDGEIAAGIPQMALIPIPGKGLAPMPTANFEGYPFYMAGQAGHRPSQAPLGREVGLTGGLPRHQVLSGTVLNGPAAIDPAMLNDPVAARVHSRNPDPNLLGFAKKLVTANLRLLPEDGTAAEKTAIQFHQGLFPGGAPITTIYGWKGIGYATFDSSGAAAQFFVNGRAPQPGAPYADPCPDTFVDGNGATRPVPLRKYRAAWITFDMPINTTGWHDRQARIAVLEQDVTATLNGQRPPEPLFFRANSGDCIDYHVTNLIPANLNLDDFQVYQGTDIIGQHIHLVKFDVTSSDGAGNGWNYESGGFSPEAVRERINANNAYQQSIGGNQFLTATVNPVFGPGLNNVWVGAQTHIERWWADPLVNTLGKDRTLRTVFTHDHFGPSGHQHHGLYAGLVIEPTASVWQSIDGTTTFGSRIVDGGPTSFASNIIAGSNGADSYREFMMEIADFSIVYTKGALQPVNPPNHVEHPLPIAIGSPVVNDPSQKPTPEAISAADVGTQVMNYRNEPIPLRIGSLDSSGQFVQKTGNAGDLAFAFSSAVHGDPFTPIMKAYPGDSVQFRLLQGAQEEQHVINIHGHRWLFEPTAPNSGFTNAQAIGISEHFEFLMADKVMPVFSDNGIADFLYQSAATDNLWDGMWGLMRSFRNHQPDVANLPNNPLSPPSGGAASVSTAPDNPLKTSGAVSPAPGQELGASTDAFAPGGQGINSCPTVAGSPPIQTFTVQAWMAKDLVGPNGIVYNKNFGFKDPAGIVYINANDFTAITTFAKPLEPLVLRINAGDCVELTLQNKLPTTVAEYDSWNEMPPTIPQFNFNQVKTSNRVSLHPQLLFHDVTGSDGASIGQNPDTTVGPGQSIRYAWYAGTVTVSGLTVTFTPIEYGTTHLRDYGDVIKHSSHGAIGTLIVEPKGSTQTLVTSSNATADVRNSGSDVLLFREFVLNYQDDLTMQNKDGVAMQNLGGIDDSEETGMKAFNYKMEPLWARLGLPPETVLRTMGDQDYTNTLSSLFPNAGCGTTPCDPVTPLFTAKAGTSVRFRVLETAGHPRMHGFTVFGHHWNFEPWTKNSTVLGFNPFTFEIGSQSGIGPTRHLNILTKAGGLNSITGDYLYRSQDSFNFSGGQWGIFRVTAP
jgi:hypothetical protein